MRPSTAYVRDNISPFKVSGMGNTVRPMTRHNYGLMPLHAQSGQQYQRVSGAVSSGDGGGQQLCRGEAPVTGHHRE